MKPPKHAFATFPKFSRLTLADREKWEALVADYPPISQISFAELMIWWDTLGALRVAQLNNNLVISYWFPGSESRSGLSLVGTRQIDESICIIFDWQKEQGDSPNLVHVPEFVLKKIRYPELYHFTPERKEDECILELNELASLDELSGHKRASIKRLAANLPKGAIRVNSIDLSIQHVQDEILQLTKSWEWQGGFNDLGRVEQECFVSAVREADALGMGNMCVSIGGEVQSILLFHLPADEDYAIVTFGRFNYDIPHIFELTAHLCSAEMVKRDIKFANIESDLGLQSLRSAKLFLGPSNYFRKYTVRPKA